ncbi:hypothetical protein N7491_004360 [Penicillium cf. griseofulvum]|uniref:Uncharacterized protein n=1 Tax=Penicillium cf. griseofulvum TaxID=2972120 RepID=A0A9W9M395_9EURO|nr:hypothetical protein N7472_007050 [Penicillium cf. griseofulvum]KAJ5423018.1 hypothetical protein N7445_011126 [Penicillium cf. griseofulvum]KAJ5433765.1 hypothetical protein N7491_004360 [Penicillium cf. griseofulvum]
MSKLIWEVKKFRIMLRLELSWPKITSTQIKGYTCQKAHLHLRFKPRTVEKRENENPQHHPRTCAEDAGKNTTGQPPEA